MIDSVKRPSLISIIIPIYNESENIPLMVEEINKVSLKYPYEILFINDGSDDSATLFHLERVHQKYPFVKYISFVRNFGHQIALKAGIDHANGDCVISMDGDLQHPPALLPLLIEKWQEGSDIVITKRVDYGDVGFLKKITSKLYYKFISNLLNIPVQDGESDFRLLDRSVILALRQFNEITPFYRGLVRWIGFNSAEVSYKANNRIHGKSKYSFKKMLKLGIGGVLSFSLKPLYLSIYLGFFSALMSIVVFFYSLISLYLGHVVQGWTSTLIIIAFFSGIQMIVFGIFGLYLSNMFLQVKNRPLYIVGKNTYKKDDERN